MPANANRRAYENRWLRHAPIVLDARAREIVQRTIQKVATHHGWVMHAINVRTNHVHFVISANSDIERVMNNMKSWTTRRLVESGVFPRGMRLWVRHGSTRYLWKPEHVQAACRYVVEGQGDG